MPRSIRVMWRSARDRGTNDNNCCINRTATSSSSSTRSDVVLGAVTLVGEATLQRGPIPRDTSFFLLVATVMLIIFSGSFAFVDDASMDGWLDRYVAGSVVASIITRRNKKKNNKDDFGLVQGSRG